MENNYPFSKSAQKMRASKIRELMKYASMPGVISLAGGIPDPDNFAFDSVTEIINTWEKDKFKLAMQYGPTPGFPLLTDLLKERMIKNRNIDMNNQDLIITSGGQQALFLTARIFVNPGDVVIVEEPSFIGGLAAYLANGAELVGVPLEDDGVNVQKLEETYKKLTAEGKNVKYFYTIPNFQNPAGVTMSQEKRKAVYELSKKYDLIVLEDDPYCDLYFTDSPEKYLPIKAHGNDAKIIYLGSFSKILCPGFRLGWMVADLPIIDKACLAKQSVDACSSSFGQIIAYDYLKAGHIDTYLAKMRTIYKEKKEFMVNMIKKHIPEEVRATNPEGGFFLYLYLPEKLNAEQVFKKAFEEKVAFVTGDTFHVDQELGARTIRLAYSNSTMEQIEKGVSVIGKAIKSFL